MNTFKLAHTILFEHFKHKHNGGKITLSSEITGMSRESRRRAINEVRDLGLITIEREGHQATQVRPTKTGKKNTE